VMLGLAGQVNRAGIGLGLALVPAVALGFLAAMPLRARLRGGRMRAAVLICAALAGVGLILRAALPTAA